ncbi:flavin monoamine oxidase family protein [Methyloversatilis sp.]|uniref:flavin monoamine oxidase family protein n=1 Tax=Methyloversatilis sp. TaxID=2569862 RepID=UPI0035ADFC10
MLDTLIVGAGLCGLDIARRLEAAGRSVLIVEARERAGGRILTVPAESGGVALDLGPGWFWPQVQPRMLRLVEELGLAHFPQHDEGPVLHLGQADGSPEALAERSVHNGARRVSGGMVAVVAAILRRLSPDRLRAGCELRRLVSRDGKVEAHCRSGREDVVIVARSVVLALPPRLVAERIAFEPALDGAVLDTLRDTPTWMAAQAKAALRFPSAVWREHGLTGNAFVTHAQAVLAEVFDACDADGKAAALAGFVALPPSMRAACSNGVLPLMVRSQFAQLFGPELDEGELHMQDWAQEPLTCSTLDAVEPGGHPDDGIPLLATPLWGGRLHLAGSETAGRGAGYLEGALDAAERVATRLLASPPSPGALPANEESIVSFSAWVERKRGEAVELYRQSAVQALSAWRSGDMTHAVLCEVIDHVYDEALQQLDMLVLDLDGVPVERGRSALTPLLLAPFSGFSDALLGEALKHNRTSCAISNFPQEHDPSPDYVARIRGDLASAWRAFAQSLNQALLDRARSSADALSGQAADGRR